MNQNDFQKQISDFRVDLLREMPFYGELMSHFEIKESRAVSTAGTDGRAILYNSAVFQELNEGQRNYILMHELMHIILQHPYRAHGKHEKVWALAADYVANGLLDDLIADYRRSGKSDIPFQKPSNGFYMLSYEGESAEQLYHNIYERNKDRLKKYGRLKLEVQNACGVVQVVEIEKKDLDLLSGITKEEMNLIAAQVNGWTDEAIKNWSDDPSARTVLQQLFLIDQANMVPWKTLLKRFLQEHETIDVSYDHPERKYLHMDMFLPGEGRETEEKTLDDVWAFIDTSGSVSADEKNEFITQLYRICRQFHTTINVGYWDMAMHEVYRNVSQAQLLNASTEYSGGTRADAVYDYLNENRIKAAVILILTDGYFDRVPEWKILPYRKKTIVVLSATGEYHCTEMGKVTRLDMKTGGIQTNDNQ